MWDGFSVNWPPVGPPGGGQLSPLTRDADPATTVATRLTSPNGTPRFVGVKSICRAALVHSDGSGMDFLWNCPPVRPPVGPPFGPPGGTIVPPDPDLRYPEKTMSYKM